MFTDTYSYSTDRDVEYYIIDLKATPNCLVKRRWTFISLLTL